MAVFKAIVFLFIAAATSASADSPIVLGNARLAVPGGWTVVRQQPDRVTLKSKDGRQQTSFSSLTFAAAPSFEEFKRICAHRVQGERLELKDGFIEPDVPQPFRDGDSLGMFFSGSDRASGRVFSGYLTLKDRQLVTVYVEGLGVDPKEHLRIFKEFVQGLSRKG
jgi:hypothetical protein